MLGKLIDSKTRVLYLLAIMVGVVALLGAGMMVMTKFSGGQISVESEAATQDPTKVIAVGDVSVDASDVHAAEMFACKVDDMHDSAAVASLLMVMDLENAIGKYSVQIAEKDGVPVLTLTTELPVKNNDEAAFNSNMDKYAQQLLALIPQLDKVEWIYSVKASGSETQEVGDMDDAAAAKFLGKAPEDYGKSERAFGKLLTQQAQ